MPSARSKTIDIQRACVTADSVAIYDSLSRSEPGVTHHTYLNLTNGHCDCDCKSQGCTHWPGARDAGFAVLTIWMPRYHCIHIRLAIADSISRGERGDTGEINVLEAPTMPYNTEQETTMPHARPVAMAKIRTDSTAQFRAELNDNHVQNLMDSMENGAKLPSVTIYRDDAGTHWLADGFHTYEAHRRLERESILAELIPGTQRDAVLHGAGANADHGLPRTNADKRRAVTRLLDDEEWGKWKSKEVAAACRVSPEYVNLIKREREAKAGTDVTKNVFVSSPADNTPAAPSHVATINTATGAIEATDGTQAPAAANNAGNGTQGANSDPCENDLSDTEWLAALPLSARLAGDALTVFQEDALYYRTLVQRELMGKLKHATDASERQARANTPTRGELLSQGHTLARTQHPKSWKPCPTCGGSRSFWMSATSKKHLEPGTVEPNESNQLEARAVRVDCDRCKGGYVIW